MCGDDGFVWQQKVECGAATESNSGSGTATETESATDGSATQPTLGMSESQTATESGSGSNSETNGGGAWCADADGDGFGDPNNCQPDMFPGSVPNDDDCDDGDPNTFPGSAPNDSATACMTDADNDDWGDDTPGPGVEPGSDCADSSASVHEGCLCSAGESSCQGDDLLTCNADGTGQDMMTCEFGCDDADPKCWDALTVDAGKSACVPMGMSVGLNATAMGGDGNYAYAWTPPAGLDDAMIQGPQATPAAPTSYTVSVTDGEGNMASDSVSVFLQDVALDLDPQVCTVYDFPHEVNPDNNDPVSVWSWDPVGKELCQTLNAKASALYCGWELEDASITGLFSVNTNQDDDWLGFMWGIQDENHFYVFTWKQIEQVGNTCGNIMMPAGMQVKVIDVADPMGTPLSCPDIHAPMDTPNSRLLVAVDDFTTMGWEDNTQYKFLLSHFAGGQMKIEVRRADNDMLVAMKDFTDPTYAKGKFGMYTKSQINACFSDIKVFCEP